MTFAIPSSSGSQLPLALDELNALKHAVIGNPRRKADVLADDALVKRLVAQCRAELGEDLNARASRLEAVIVLGSLSHAGKQAMPTLLVLPDLLPNLLSSLRAALPAFSGPSSAQPTAASVDLKALTVVLQSLANSVGAMHGLLTSGRWGSGLGGDEQNGSAQSEATRIEWRSALGRQVYDFLLDGATTDLLTLLPALPACSSEDAASPVHLPARALVSLLQLLHDLVSSRKAFRSTLRPVWSFKGKERAAQDESDMEVDDLGFKRRSRWVLNRVEGVLQTTLAAAKNARGDQSKAIRAAFRLVAVAGPGIPSAVLDDAVRAGFAHPDEGVRFGAAYLFSSTVSRARETPLPIEAFARYFTVLLGLWADIALPLTASASAAAASAMLTDSPDKAVAKVMREDQIQAVFQLTYVVPGRVQVHALMAEMGVLRRMGELLGVGSGNDVEWRETNGTPPGSNLGSRDDASDELKLGEEDRESHARLREGLLLTFAAVALSSTQHHAALVLLPGLMRSTLASLGHPTASIRAAACQLVRGLSRNVGILRETLVDSGVGQPLVAILKGNYGVDGREREEVLAGALAAAANLLLDLSPMKETLLQAEILPCIVAYAQKPWAADVRLNALWALKNFAYRASQRHRLRLLESLSALHLPDVDWAQDSESEEAKEVANLLGNLLIGADSVVQQAALPLLQSSTLDAFLSAATAAKPMTEASRAAFVEVCPLIRYIHEAQPTKAGDPRSMPCTRRLLHHAASALEYGVPGTQLSLARLIGTMIEDLKQADPDRNARLFEDPDTLSRLEAICAHRPLDVGSGAGYSVTVLTETLVWLASCLAREGAGDGS